MPKLFTKPRGLKSFKRVGKGSKEKNCEKDNVVRKQYDDSTEEDIHEDEPSILTSDEDEEIDEELVHVEKLEHSRDSRVDTHRKRKTEAKSSRNSEEDRDDKLEAFHLLNKCDQLEGIMYNSGSTALLTEASENKDESGTVNASLSDDGDVSDDASEDADEVLQLAEDIGCPTVAASGVNSLLSIINATFDIYTRFSPNLSSIGVLHAVSLYVMWHVFYLKKKLRICPDENGDTSGRYPPLTPRAASGRGQETAVLRRLSLL